ncbi:MAG TPA: DUF1932 domain-containing protein [Burkholderiales bacterium]|nr:DUF1932 domain-containing protein [Burkholderiales bacterium]
MQLSKVGVLSPGDMGQAVAGRIKATGREVYTSLAGRSERTAALAKEAGLTDAGSVRKVVETCDAVLSVMNPGSAVDAAREVAQAMRKTKKKLVYVDCNAIAPQTVKEIETLISEAGGTFIDGGIIGPPPRGKAKTKLYISGPNATLLTEIEDEQLRIRVVGERNGDASAVKMCYASMTKGTMALGMELLIAARKLGVEEQVVAEMQDSQGDMLEWVLSRSVSMPPKAYRWVPEMNEIAKTFEGAGLTPRILLGAADMYEFIAATPLGKESPEDARKAGRSGTDIVHGLADGTS